MARGIVEHPSSCSGDVPAPWHGAACCPGDLGSCCLLPGVAGVTRLHPVCTSGGGGAEPLLSLNSAQSTWFLGKAARDAARSVAAPSFAVWGGLASSFGLKTNQHEVWRCLAEGICTLRCAQTLCHGAVCWGAWLSSVRAVTSASIPHQSGEKRPVFGTRCPGEEGTPLSLPPLSHPQQSQLPCPLPSILSLLLVL